MGKSKGATTETGPIYTYKELLLNIDVAATAFYTSGPLTDVIGTFFGQSIGQCQNFFKNNYVRIKLKFTYFKDMKKLDSFLRGVNVTITYRQTGRRNYKIKRITKESVQESKLTLDTPQGLKIFNHNTKFTSRIQAK